MAVALRLGPAAARFTGRAEGDLSFRGGDGREVEARRRAVSPLPWTWLRQVHGAHVVEVAAPGDGAGTEGDAAVTSAAGAALAILTADCAPVALASDEGVVAAAHAGWRGLVAGVLERTVDAMRARGATGVRAVLGPCIHAGCYEFGEADLDRVAARLGDGVRGSTTQGRPALDLPRGVEAALASVGVEVDRRPSICTACSADYFSHRRGDAGRQALVVWAPAGPVHDR